MELDSKIGKVLRAGLEGSKKEFDKAISYYLSLQPQGRMLYAKDILLDFSPGGGKSFETYSFTTEIPTEHIDILEEGLIQLRTIRDAKVSGIVVWARLKEQNSKVSDSYWSLGQINFGRDQLEADVKISEGDGQHLPLEDPNVAPLLEVIDSVVIDKINENTCLRRKLGNEAIAVTPPDLLCK
jgi:hypothetical protein